MENNKRIFKLLLMGDSGVGKTSFMHRYLERIFPENVTETIGVEFFTVNMTYNDSLIKFRIWDLGGHEKWFQLHELYCEGSQIAFLFYDLSNEKSINHLTQWALLFRKVNHLTPLILIGTKTDLLKDLSFAEEMKKNPFFNQFIPKAHFCISSKKDDDLLLQTIFQTASKLILEI